jgi:hypothetical protein
MYMNSIGTEALEVEKDERRAGKRRTWEDAQAPGGVNDENASNNRCETRCNWQSKYDELFGDWIYKVAYTCERTGKVFYMAGCTVCKENGAVRGLGAFPTKKLKKSTFMDHELSQGHVKVGH